MGGLYAQPNEWENPVRYEWNKEKPHTGFALYESTDDARTEDYALSPWYQSLNGTWKFRYAPSIEESVKDFYRVDLSDDDWNEIQVPSNWDWKDLASRLSGTSSMFSRPILLILMWIILWALTAPVLLFLPIGRIGR